MSDDWITVIPEDPQFVPEGDRQQKAREWFARNTPEAWEIKIELCDKVKFFDCAQNFERVVCPSCRTEIPTEWWQQRMDEDYGGGFKLLKYPAPCCGSRHTLHELVYDWPQGFGRFAVDVMNPNVGKLTDEQVRELAQILGTPVRIIYQHV